MEHLLAGAFDGGCVGAAIVRHVAASRRRRRGQPAGTWRVRRVSLRDRHGVELLRDGSCGGSVWLKTKDPRRPARVRRKSVLVELAALAPLRSSVSPGAGNEPKKAIKPRKRAKKLEEGYVGEAGGFDWQMHSPSISRHDDSDGGAAVSTIEPAHRASD